MNEIAIDKIHTTSLGTLRIKRNLGLTVNDVIAWCKEAIEKADIIICQGKNWYVYKDGVVITVNAKSFTVITAHKIKGKIRTIHADHEDYLMVKDLDS